MQATVIINPIAGPGRRRTLDACVALARDTLSIYDYTADVLITSGPADAFRFAAQAVAHRHDLVVAWGGDGTVNGAGAAVAGSDIPLAIVPGGSGNGLARDLGLPLKAAPALKIAATGKTRAIDAGELNGSLFFNVAGIGLDAHIAHRMAAPGARRGLIGYVWSTCSELVRYEARDYELVNRGGPPDSAIKTPALFIALANSRQYGIGAQIAPRAKIDDGALDIVVVRPLSAYGVLSRLPALFRGTLGEDERILMRTASELDITSDHEIRFHVDGEPRIGSKTLSLRTRPKVLCVKVSI